MSSLARAQNQTPSKTKRSRLSSTPRITKPARLILFTINAPSRALVHPIVRQVLVMKLRSVQLVERYRAPHPLLPDTGANPGPDHLRQGANFADSVLRWVNTIAIGNNNTNDGTKPCPTFRLRFPVRQSKPPVPDTGFPGALSSCRLVHHCWNNLLRILAYRTASDFGPDICLTLFCGILHVVGQTCRNWFFVSFLLTNDGGNGAAAKKLRF
jgi:hypothetical protein